MSFPADFRWGVATASYQIEGSPYLVGGGHSVWDMFCKRPGAIHDASNGDIACDHFNRYREDCALMKDLGIENYRLSLSWPRILPTGRGTVDQAGLDFYDNLIDCLLEHGIDPHVTLFHWDTPYDIYLQGSWLNADISKWFADYTEIVSKKLGDRVASWMTLNEPQVFLGLGYETGSHAPGDKLGQQELLWASHNALLAHGRSAQVLRSNITNGAQIGWAPVGVCSIPASDSAADIEAARKATLEMDSFSIWSLPLWNDPVFFGTYPECINKLWETSYYKPAEGDMQIINQVPDFFGANIYNAPRVRAGADGKPEVLPHPQGMARTIYHWPVTPEALYWGPKFFYEKYGKPIVITENGLGLSDWPHVDGKIHDPQRIDFLTRYMREFHRAGQDGVEIAGYFQWSLMDNFEWNEGYRFRFGLVYVDYETQVRNPKDSAYWYRDVIGSNGDIALS